MKRKIGTFSGTFDPVHVGHVSFVKAAIVKAKLDGINIIVERSPRNKSPEASLEDRLEMTRLAFNDVGCVNVTPSVASVTTIDVVEHHRDEAYVLVGSDVIDFIKQWHGIESWSNHVKLIVGMRSDDKLAVVMNKLKPIVFKEVVYIEHVDSALASSSLKTLTVHTPKQVEDYARRHHLYASRLL